MKIWLAGAALILLNLCRCLRADTEHFWQVTSPDHGQTWAYGTEQRRVWKQVGRDGHLALFMNFTNDPFVDRDNPRQYDYFTFAFPQVTLGADGRTFYYRVSDGAPVAVARKEAGFLGIDEIHLLPGTETVVHQPHGRLTVSLVSRPVVSDD